MAGRLLNDPDADGWERSDFPIVCETCLGPNPYVRMQKVRQGFWRKERRNGKDGGDGDEQAAAAATSIRRLFLPRLPPACCCIIAPSVAAAFQGPRPRRCLCLVETTDRAEAGERAQRRSKPSQSAVDGFFFFSFFFFSLSLSHTHSTSLLLFLLGTPLSQLPPHQKNEKTQIEFGGQCHISGRPYTVFRWKPGAEARYKKTVICKEVAKAKHVCQVCLLDLDYNLPVQVRDAAMGIAVDPLAPKSDVGREYALTNATERGTLGIEYLQHGGGGGGGAPLAIAGSGAGPSALAVAGGGASGSGDNSLALSLPSSSSAAAPFGGPNPTLAALARKAPNFDRNRARVCSFFAKGECKRGKSCPYRHELPSSARDDPLSRQDYKDRYYGVNDPVAAKMAERFAERAARAAAPPADRSVTTLFVGNLPAAATEGDLRAAFSKYGALSSVRFKQQQQGGGGGGQGGQGGSGSGSSGAGGGGGTSAAAAAAAAFVTFEDRSSAEGAARGLAGRLSIRGAPVKILWGKPAAPGSAAAGGGGGGGQQQQGQQGGRAAPPLYPSMDPTRAGTALVPPPQLAPPLAPPLNRERQQHQRGPGAPAGVVSARAVPAGMGGGEGGGGAGKRGGGGGADGGDGGGRGKKPRT